MPAYAVFIDTCAYARIDIYRENIALYGVTLIGKDNNGVVVRVESYNVFDNPWAFCKLFDELSVLIKQV